MKATPIKPGQVYRVSGFGAQIDVIATNAMRAAKLSPPCASPEYAKCMSTPNTGT